MRRIAAAVCAAALWGCSRTPPAPALVIVTPQRATSGESGFPASVAGSPGLAYQWSVDGGAVVSGQGTSSIQFSVSAPAGGTVLITCNTINAAGDATPSSASVAVIAPPLTPVLHGLPPVPFITAGRSLAVSIDDAAPYTIAWTVSGGTLDSGQATRAIAVTAGATGTLTISVRVDNGAGGVRSASAARPPR